MRRVMVSTATVVLLVAVVGDPGSRRAAGVEDDCCGELPGLATCKGEDPCKVCTDCTRCRHCRDGGSCGACKPDASVRRSSLSPAVVTLLIGVQSSPSEARTKAKAKAGKKAAPPLLQAGAEVTLTLAGDESAGDPIRIRSGVVGPGSLVLMAYTPEGSGPSEYRSRRDTESHNRLLEATRLGDKGGVDVLIAEGRAVRLADGTRLLVTRRALRRDPDNPSRVLGGDPTCDARVVAGEHTGKVVEVPVRNLRPAGPT
jgi:hypothetical protein